MIYSDKITSDTVLIRFHYYSDVNMGWGDSGTILYKRIPLKFFTQEIFKRIDGSTTYNYTLTPEGWQYAGVSYTSDIGYDKASEKGLEQEKKELRETITHCQNLLNKLENI